MLLSAFAVFFGFIIAMMLALCRMCKVAPLRWLATAYVEVFRATPMLVQVLLIYNISLLAFPDMPSFRIFGLFIFRRFVPGVVALSLNSGAYLSEGHTLGHQLHPDRADGGPRARWACRRARPCALSCCRRP